MSRLSLRRFPESVTRRRQEPGYRDERGRWVPGIVNTVAMRASVQPLDLEDSDIAGGVQLSERLKIYVPEENALVAAFEDREADEVIYGGETYTVIESRSWQGGHTRATMLRET